MTTLPANGAITLPGDRSRSMRNFAISRFYAGLRAEIAMTSGAKVVFSFTQNGLEKCANTRRALTLETCIRGDNGW